MSEWGRCLVVGLIFRVCVVSLGWDVKLVTVYMGTWYCGLVSVFEGIIRRRRRWGER